MPLRPRWLEAYATPKARAPQKAPPEGGALRVDKYAIPLELRHHDAWACWHYEFDHDRWSKPPYNPESGQRAEPGDESTWSSFDRCYQAYLDGNVPASGGRPYDGLSFALNYRWGIVGLDLDHLSLHRLDADHIVRTLDAYAEYSPSRDGYRIFVRGSLPEGRRRRDWVEMSTRRFFSVTGHKLEGARDIIRPNPGGLYDVWERYVQRG
jgi:primase-polymerase (primpol)-like protein